MPQLLLSGVVRLRLWLLRLGLWLLKGALCLWVRAHWLWRPSRQLQMSRRLLLLPLPLLLLLLLLSWLLRQLLVIPWRHINALGGLLSLLPPPLLLLLPLLPLPAVLLGPGVLRGGAILVRLVHGSLRWRRRLH
jgi:hypothetical protein